MSVVDMAEDLPARLEIFPCLNPRSFFPWFESPQVRL